MIAYLCTFPIRKMKSYILSIETATDSCSVALHKAKRLVASSISHIPKSHSSQLTTLIRQTLSKANIMLGDLGAIAVSIGPGSYTGTRIGVSMANGLAYGCKAYHPSLALIPINTLQIIAAKASKKILKNGYVLPLIDARRERAYTLLTQGKNKPHTTILSVNIANLPIQPNDKDPLYIAGSGADQYINLLAHPYIKHIPNIKPEATTMGEIAYEALVDKKNKYSTYLKALYI